MWSAVYWGGLGKCSKKHKLFTFGMIELRKTIAQQGNLWYSIYAKIYRNVQQELCVTTAGFREEGCFWRKEDSYWAESLGELDHAAIWNKYTRQYVSNGRR